MSPWVLLPWTRCAVACRTHPRCDPSPPAPIYLSCSSPESVRWGCLRSVPSWRETASCVRGLTGWTMALSLAIDQGAGRGRQGQRKGCWRMGWMDGWMDGWIPSGAFWYFCIQQSIPWTTDYWVLGLTAVTWGHPNLTPTSITDTKFSYRILPFVRR